MRMVLSHGVGVLWAATGGRGVAVSGRVKKVSGGAFGDRHGRWCGWFFPFWMVMRAVLSS